MKTLNTFLSGLNLGIALVNISRGFDIDTIIVNLAAFVLCGLAALFGDD